MTPLIRSLRRLLTQQLESSWHPYTVPGLWVGGKEPMTFPSAAAYLLHQLDQIEGEERRRRRGTWSLDHAVMYNAMVRHVTSYDHGPGVALDGWRTTGTFIKFIGLIPYLLRLGVNTVLLMPITEIGTQGRKGTLGSPYAVKHPLHLEPSLAEPTLEMSIEDQSRVMVECLHAVGIKVVLETILRTASIDSSLVPLHPEWFYWVDESKVDPNAGAFKAPSFSHDALYLMHEKVESGNYRGLPEPSLDYQELFSLPPRRVEYDEHGWKGIGAKGTILRIPGAFADWPADDVQPMWTDVTYLRLHDHPHYRYVAYNTVRMYERDLDTDEYRTHPLWNTIAAVIPYYIRNLNIDGAMIDMGHALPRDLRRKVIREARALKSDLLFFEENFTLTTASKDAGYDAAIGYLPLDACEPSSLPTFVQRIADSEIPTRYFSTPESHNTKRAVDRMNDPEHVINLWQALRLLPGGIPFIHAGMELGERIPVNTGLGFAPDDLEVYPPEKLPLFSDVPLPWDDGVPYVDTLRKGNGQLTSWHAYQRMTSTDTILPVTSDPRFIAWWRYADHERSGLLIIHELEGKGAIVSLEMPAEVAFLSPRQGVMVNGRTVEIELTARQTRAIPFLSVTNA